MMSFRDACRTAHHAHIIHHFRLFVARSDRESGRLGGSATAGHRWIFLPGYSHLLNSRRTAWAARRGFATPIFYSRRARGVPS